LSFSSVDGSGGLARRPAAPTPTGATGIPLSVSGTYTPVTSFAGPPTAGHGIPSSVGGTLPARIDPQPVVPPFKPGPIGSSDGGAAAYDSSPDVSGVGQQVSPFLPARKPVNFDAFPSVVNAKSLQQLGVEQLGQSFNDYLRNLVIGYGDPQLAAQAGFGLDPQAGAFARANYLSGNASLARLDKQRGDANRALVNRLASHGLLFSGDLGYGQKQTDTAVRKREVRPGQLAAVGAASGDGRETAA
jgi:hypothetical protein